MGGFRTGDVHHGKVIVPTKPQIRTISWQCPNTGNIIRQRLVFPHTLFVMYYTQHKNHNYKYFLNRLCVAFSKQPFTGLSSDRLYGLPVGNLDAGFGVCFYNWPYSDDVYDFADQVIKQYWESPFVDYHDNFSYWLEKYYHTNFLNNWEKATNNGDYDWLSKQELCQPEFHLSLQQLFLTNKTSTEENDILVPING